MAKLDTNARIRKAAEGGDSFAQFEAGLDLDIGRHGQQDYEKAARYYIEASKQGNCSAKNNLLLLHVCGHVKILEPEVVLADLRELAGSGDRDGQINFGLCFELGYGTVQDYAQAAVWYRRAAEAGLARAQFNLGGFYLEGKGVDKDLNAAILWYTRAAEQRDELALLQLGNLYLKGISVEANPERAFLLFLIAYRQGSSRAANHLASMFRQGLAVEKDPALAFELYLECVNWPDVSDTIENRSYPASAYYWLGHMAEHGNGTKRDLAAAKRWYRRGTECESSACRDALKRLNSKRITKRRRSKVVH